MPSKLRNVSYAFGRKTAQRLDLWPPTVCAELSALCAKYPEKTHRSLTTLFAELDAFKFRCSTLSTLARPQYLLSQQSVLTDNNSNFNLKPSLVLLDNTIYTANSN